MYMTGDLIDDTSGEDVKTRVLNLMEVTVWELSSLYLVSFSWLLDVW